MRKSTKGALAGVAAVALLLGGFGTRANWDAGGTFGGTDVKDGSLSLSGVGCEAWQLKKVTDSVFSALTTAQLSALYLLPGDVLERHCEFTVNLLGVASADVVIGAPSFRLSASGLSDGLALTADFTKTHGTTNTDIGDESTGVPSSSAVTVVDGDKLSADLSISLASGAANVWQGVTGTLDDVAVTISPA